MSHENVELVLRAFRAATTLPKPDFATVNELFHPDHTLLPLMRHVEGGEELHGARGYQAFLSQRGHLGLSDNTGDAPVSWEVELESGVDVSSDKVLTVGTL